VQPNAAHLALAELERAWPGGLMVVTQTVDDLHERAGSVNVVHMHGELAKVRCNLCGTVSTWAGNANQATPCPACGRSNALRPHIVWFGEEPFELGRIRKALEGCGLFVSVGTSGSVYPAAGFVGRVQPAAYSLELNLEPSEVSGWFREHRTGLATERVPELVHELLAGIIL
jgi:NAD-dependent deacetylase